MQTSAVTGNELSLREEEAIIYDKNSKTIEYLGSHRGQNFQSNTTVKTTPLNACMAIYIQSKDKLIALHVSPAQAADEQSSIIEAYSQLKLANFKKGETIEVIVGGHTQNFNKAVFQQKIQEMGLIIKQPIMIMAPPSDRIAIAEFDMENKTLNIKNFPSSTNQKTSFPINVQTQDKKMISSNNNSLFSKSKPLAPSLKPSLSAKNNENTGFISKLISKLKK